MLIKKSKKYENQPFENEGEGDGTLIARPTICPHGFISEAHYLALLTLLKTKKNIYTLSHTKVWGKE